ncbi:MAG: helix-turn-helix domain-containing protein [Deltaproteobacteria bacterium]|nr:helix-turn-helix domain-containing protein [Deltaproteobacteria bacterium]
MPARNALLKAPPHPVEKALRTLGANLRTARLRRGLSLEEIAEKIGTGRRAVADAEKGKPSTAVAVYVALLWALGLLEHMDEVADPAADEVGSRLALAKEKKRASRPRGLSNDF